MKHPASLRRIAIDELAVALKIDPVELRLRNHADIDPEKDLPWSSKSLKECYRDAGERPAGQTRPETAIDARWSHTNRLGNGECNMADISPTGNRDGPPARGWKPLIRTASHDIGPGTYTMLTQIAADALGLAVANVRVEIGDSRFPTAPVEGGSMTAASVGSAVHEACTAVRAKLIGLASTLSRNCTALPPMVSSFRTVLATKGRRQTPGELCRSSQTARKELDRGHA